METPEFPYDRSHPVVLLASDFWPSGEQLFALLDSAGVRVIDGFTAFAVCPGQHLHGVQTYADDCSLYYSRHAGRWWIECDHTECAFEVATVNIHLAKFCAAASDGANQEEV